MILDLPLIVCLFLGAVFHVTDLFGKKVSEDRIMNYIQQVRDDIRSSNCSSLSSLSCRCRFAVMGSLFSFFFFFLRVSWGSSCLQTLGARKKREVSSVELLRCPGRSVGVKSIAEHTVIELTGTDRPGLLSEVSAVLTETGCNVNAAEVWTHNLRVACVIYVTDEETAGPVANGSKLERIKNQLFQVMKSGDDEIRGAKTDFGTEVTHTERRLHQMMFADRDYEEALELPTTTTRRCSNSSSIRSLLADKEKPVIAIQSRNERGYSVINISCKDRPKLLFDIVCTLTDMQYVVFHATIDSNGTDAEQVCTPFHAPGARVSSFHARR
jgi:predicted amino acid-binding ACT domain protein